jgi:hypothetical protein
MPKKRRSLRPWEVADHRFAVATVALLIFFVVTGVANWLLVDLRPSSAEAARSTSPNR